MSQLTADLLRSNLSVRRGGGSSLADWVSLFQLEVVSQ